MTGTQELNKGDIITNPEETFYRRTFRRDKRYIDPKTGEATSRAFTPRPKDNGELSVNLCRLSTPEESILDPSKFALFIFKNRVVLRLGLNSIYDPTSLEEDGFDNPAHCIISKIAEDDESIPGILARSAKPLPF